MRNRNPFIAAAMAAACAMAVNAQAAESTASKKGQASANAPLIVLMPVTVASADTLGNGCWARLYDGQNFSGNQLSLVGPVDMPNMRTAFGTDWSGEFDSIAVGPRATVTVYDNENYGQRVAKFQPSQRVADLGDKMGFFEDIRSLKIACSGKPQSVGAAPASTDGGGSPASSGSGGSARSGGSGGSASASASGSGSGPTAGRDFSKLDTDNDGYLGLMEAAADQNAKQHFNKLDSNRDNRISRSEWEAASSSTGSSSSPGSSSR